MTAAGIFEIDGALALAFPSSATPYILRREEVGQAFPAQLYANRYTTATMAIGADAYLKVPGLDVRVRLGGAYLLYNAPGYVAFGGGIDFDFFDIVSIAGHADGEFNFANATVQPRRARQGLRRRHHLRGRRRAGLRHRGRGCVNVDVGFTRRQRRRRRRLQPVPPGHLAVRRLPLDALRRSHVFSASAAQSGAPLRVKVKAGDPSLGGAARRRRRRAARARHDAGGQVVREHAGSRRQPDRGDPDPALRAAEDHDRRAAGPQARDVHDRAAAGLTGDHEDDRGRGSAEGAITASVSDAAPPPRRAARRRPPRPLPEPGDLSYDIRPRPGQKVTFVEVGTGGRRVIGTASSGRGTLTFTPAPGAGAPPDRGAVLARRAAGRDGHRRALHPAVGALSRPARVRVRRRGSRTAGELAARRRRHRATTSS